MASYRYSSDSRRTGSSSSSKQSSSANARGRLSAERLKHLETKYNIPAAYCRSGTVASASSSHTAAVSSAEAKRTDDTYKGGRGNYNPSNYKYINKVQERQKLEREQFEYMYRNVSPERKLQARRELNHQQEEERKEAKAKDKFYSPIDPSYSPTSPLVITLDDNDDNMEHQQLMSYEELQPMSYEELPPRNMEDDEYSTASAYSNDYEIDESYSPTSPPYIHRPVSPSHPPPIIDDQDSVYSPTSPPYSPSYMHRAYSNTSPRYMYISRSISPALQMSPREDNDDEPDEPSTYVRMSYVVSYFFNHFFDNYKLIKSQTVMEEHIASLLLERYKRYQMEKGVRDLANEYYSKIPRFDGILELCVYLGQHCDDMDPEPLWLKFIYILSIAREMMQRENVRFLKDEWSLQFYYETLLSILERHCNEEIKRRGWVSACKYD